MRQPMSMEVGEEDDDSAAPLNVAPASVAARNACLTAQNERTLCIVLIFVLVIGIILLPTILKAANLL